MAWWLRTSLNNQWKYSSIEREMGPATNRMCVCVDCSDKLKHKHCVLLVRKGHDVSVYERIKKEMTHHHYIRIALTAVMRARGDIYMAFVHSEGKDQYEKFTRCKACKGDHGFLQCERVTCYICRKRGHLTRNCPQAVCRRCKRNGLVSHNHIASRCPRAKCSHCKKYGHVTKYCPSRIEARKQAKKERKERKERKEWKR